jgi:3-hydroxyisobutyrate dehydrogenase-like beta-hydroxyacid dehydrogenase
MELSISVFGLGLMGRPIARRLLAAGYKTCGWNRSPLAEGLSQGIPLCATLAAAARSQVCLLMLANSAAVGAVLDGLEPHLFAGQVVLDMSSSDPADSKIRAERLAAQSIGWVDAPVSGGPEGAAAGTLAVMAGGNETDFARVKSVLETLGSNVVCVGGPGAGHTVKIVNQVIVALTIEAVAEALTLAEKSGIDPRLVQQALRGGFADSKILQLHGSRMIERAYLPGGKVWSQIKDLHLAQGLAASVSATLPHLASVTQFYERLVAQGDGELDHSAVHKLLWR